MARSHCSARAAAPVGTTTRHPGGRVRRCRRRRASTSASAPAPPSRPRPSVAEGPPRSASSPWDRASEEELATGPSPGATTGAGRARSRAGSADVSAATTGAGAGAAPWWSGRTTGPVPVPETSWSMSLITAPSVAGASGVAVAWAATGTMTRHPGWMSSAEVRTPPSGWTRSADARTSSGYRSPSPSSRSAMSHRVSPLCTVTTRPSPPATTTSDTSSGVIAPVAASCAACVTVVTAADVLAGELVGAAVAALAGVAVAVPRATMARTAPVIAAARPCCQDRPGSRGAGTPRIAAGISTTKERVRLAHTSQPTTVMMPMSRVPSSGRVSASMTSWVCGTSEGSGLPPRTTSATGSPTTMRTIPSSESRPRARTDARLRCAARVTARPRAQRARGRPRPSRSACRAGARA